MMRPLERLSDEEITMKIESATFFERKVQGPIEADT
jgi:hypothetical protein